MIVAVADTHAAVWYLFNDSRLSFNARQFIEQAIQTGNRVGVSSISLAELVYLSDKGRIPQSAVQNLIQALSDPENALEEIPFEARISSNHSLPGEPEAEPVVVRVDARDESHQRLRGQVAVQTVDA